MLSSSLQKIFPNEESCSNVLKSIHLDHSVKREILKSKKNKKNKDKPTIIDIMGNSAYPEIVCPKCSHNEVYKLKLPMSVPPRTRYFLSKLSNAIVCLR